MIGVGQDWQRAAIGSGGAMFVALGLGRFSYTVMVPALAESGQLGASEAGTIGWINLAGFLIGAFASETARRLALRHEISVKALLGGAVWLSVLALAASAVPYGFHWLAFWRGLLGLTAGLIMVQSLALTTAHVPERFRPRAAAYVFAGVGLAIFLSGTLMPLLLKLGLDWAWIGIALVGLCGAAVTHWAWRAETAEPPERTPTASRVVGDRRMSALILAHFCFAFGIVPHTIYWVDFIARDLQQGVASGGLHWSVAGVFAVLGPWLTAGLAERIGTAWALVVAFLCLCIGIGGPALTSIWPVIWLSTVIFGAQPGLSTLITARTRDLTERDAMPRAMRLMILASGAGAAVGGFVVTRLFHATGDYAMLFLLGGGAMALGALLTLPPRHGVRRL